MSKQKLFTVEITKNVGSEHLSAQLHTQALFQPLMLRLPTT